MALACVLLAAMNLGIIITSVVLATRGKGDSKS
jgi:hypothetical protein